MKNPKTEDKTGSALSAQRFQMLEDIARELAGDVVFPICFDVTVQLRKHLGDPTLSLAGLVMIISAEPLICCRILRLANSSLSSGGKPVRDVKTAAERLGLEAVRNAAQAMVAKQLMLSREMVIFGNAMKDLWLHSLATAQAAHVVAREFSRVNPDEAMLAGLIHDLGAFYMLYRASQYDELRVRPDTVKHLVAQWHESIGDTLFNVLGIPEDMVEAVREHEQARPLPSSPRTLHDIIYVSNLLAGGNLEWLHQDREGANEAREALGTPYLSLLDEIQGRTAQIRSLFA